MGIYIDAIIMGILLGGVYGLIAAGLSIIWGVMEVINFAHGEFLMLSMFMTYFIAVHCTLDPLLSLPFIGLVLFFFGISVYYSIIRRIMNGPMLAQVFSTYGLSLILANLALFLFGFEYKNIPEELIHLKGTAHLWGTSISLTHLVAAVGCVITYAILIWFTNATKTGKALRAVSQDKEAASLLGIKIDRMNGISWGISAACVGIAGVFLSTFFFVSPSIGITFTTLTFVIVVLGGFGSILGSFVAGFVIGLIQSIVGIILPGFELIFIFFIFFCVLLFKPQGIFGF